MATGNYTLSFTSSGLVGASQNLVVSAGPAVSVTLSQSASNASSASSFTVVPVIALLDAGGGVDARVAMPTREDEGVASRVEPLVAVFINHLKDR
mmetsp:Transcript_53796/g.117026  ORF Transcript_53796/g.117026 Transcript_53796/m.117026 type:complete len:95 (+) Transcript_53796:342-626(+)